MIPPTTVRAHCSSAIEPSKALPVCPDWGVDREVNSEILLHLAQRGGGKLSCADQVGVETVVSSMAEVERLLAILPTAEFASVSWRGFGKAIV